MATIENEGLKTKAAAEEDQYIFTVSAGITAETLSSERYLMAACQRQGLVLTQAELTQAVINAGFYDSDFHSRFFYFYLFFPHKTTSRADVQVMSG